VRAAAGRRECADCIEEQALTSGNDRYRKGAAAHVVDRRARVRAVEPAANALRAWWPALAWAALIFYASTDTFSADNTGHLLSPIVLFFFPWVTEAQLDLIHFAARKCAHFSEYFILYVLVYRGVSRLRGYWKRTWASHAWFIAAAYAALDETHQIFVASRSASLHDVLIDCLGASAAVLVVHAWHRHRALSGGALAGR